MMISRKSVIIALALLITVPTLSRQRFERWEGTTLVRRLTPPNGTRNKSAYKGDFLHCTLQTSPSTLLAPDKTGEWRAGAT